MSIDIVFSPAKPNNPFEVARRKLIEAIAATPVPHALSSFPAPEDFHAVRDHVRQAAEIFDAWLAAVGHQVKHTASCTVDMTQFEGAFTGAVDGNATYECEQAAQLAYEEVEGRELVS